MDNTYFEWDYDKIVPNVTDYIPYIEENYSVSKDAKDRERSVDCLWVDKLLLQ